MGVSGSALHRVRVGKLYPTIKNESVISFGCQHRTDSNNYCPLQSEMCACYCFELITTMISLQGPNRDDVLSYIAMVPPI